MAIPSKAFLDAIAQTVRLIRSHGVERGRATGGQGDMGLLGRVMDSAPARPPTETWITLVYFGWQAHTSGGC
jgi:hypothetical protein